MTALDAEALAAIREREHAATPPPWSWQGNVDNGEPYLASRAPGMGASVLAIGTEDRSMTGRKADEVRSYAEECGMDPDELVRDWATDRYDEPIKEPRLWFYTDHMADPARDHVVYEVAPNATTREDPKVYRADIAGIRHPDAEFIAHARTDVPRLLAEVERLTDLLNQSEGERDDLDTGAGMLLGENVELAHELERLRAENAEQFARLTQREAAHAERLAEQATEGDTGICRTCTLPIVYETVLEPGFNPRTGWSDRARVDALVCFKAVGYRHVPLVGRERGIWDAATKAAEGRLQRVRALHVRREGPVVEHDCLEGDCDHMDGYAGPYPSPECPVLADAVCAHCADQTDPGDGWEHMIRRTAYWPCSTVAALDEGPR